MSISNTKFQVWAPLLVAAGLALGILIGASMIHFKSGGELVGGGVTKFREVVNHINQSYVDEVNTEDMVNGAIKNLLEHLDPHSVFISREDVELTSADLKGEFDGIGIEFNLIRDTIVVVAPLIGGPSEIAGLQSGDKIIKVDGENVAGIEISNRDVIERLRGPKGSKVEVSILRKGRNELMDFTIKRDKIPQYSVDAAYMVNEITGYIKISRFSATTYDEFHKQLNELIKMGMKRLVLDLQGNPGGYMDRAVNIADEFIPGEQLIVSQEGKVKRYKSEYRAVTKGLFEEGPVVVLIDEGSASGSEIVAGALQDNDRAIIVGRRSFGKGLVQMPISLNDGSELRLTIARYYTPSGRCIQKPYNGDFAEYYHENNLRFDNGELFNADSVHFSDSLKYYTTKGRLVYGGGGIMPDFFVPLDTSMNSAYYFQLIQQNVLREFTLDYFNSHVEELKKMSLQDFADRFEITDQMLDEVVKLGQAANVKYDAGEFATSKPIIRNRIKSLIARSLWDNEGYYRIANEYNEIFREAMNQFEEAGKLASTGYTGNDL